MYTLSPTNIPVYTLGDRPLYPRLLTDTPMYCVAYRSWFTLSLTNILEYSPCDRPLYSGLLTDTLGKSVADRYSYILSLTGIRVISGYTWVQCSLSYFVADRQSGPGERLLYPDTFGYSVADRSLYTLSLTNILLYTLGDKPLYPGLLTDTPKCSLQVLV